ncbi:uncharacterized protein EAE97_002691 [Botrytis byssoidea]|uniref:DUF8004 domain-containing protein n=1 Tax=Botrytis byssoidea TaxID=139641 RepID=A0A9P5M8X1_9HELO|nr:uncharacterized protein EAE97_002691 [Botrytis byssoidea]KAF7951140.1 hypothetical protein EAE97_002691 [Botrytis byssoidea]
MSSSPKKRSRSVSRLHRISAYLPNIFVETDSKSTKEKVPPIPQNANIPIRQPPSPEPSADIPPVPALPAMPASAPPAPSTQQTPNKLQKEQPHNNSWPLNPSPSPDVTEPPVNQLTERRGRHGSTSNVNSLAPPSPFSAVSGNGNRSVSSPISSRPTSYTSDGENNAKASRRRSFFPVKTKSRHSSSNSGSDGRSSAWVIAGDQKIDYNISLVTNGEKVPELWEEYCDTSVHVFPESFSHGPSFKVPSLVLSSSIPLHEMITSSITKRRSTSLDSAGRQSPDASTQTGTPPETPVDGPSGSEASSDYMNPYPENNGEIHLYFPTELSTDDPTKFSPDDIQNLINVRNFFAFMTGQPLVATKSCPTTFYIFLAISSMLQKFEFSNYDGSTYGEAAAASFAFFLDEFRLADVRQSREKTIEALILGERMRSTELYHEAFVHAAGKWHSIKDLKSSLFKEISNNTRDRLERASLELSQRQQRAEERLADFEYPALFSGAASSKTSAESKIARFQNWKTNYLNMRRHVLSYYKIVHGQWPPKQKTKNQFVEGGLNRKVLKQLYSDMCNLYDFMADRDTITTRSMDSEDQDVAHAHPIHLAARKILAEFDRSSPPVLPPIPFDIPKIPTMASIEPGYPLLSPKDQHKASTRKLKEYELLLILAKSHNLDADKKTPFMEMHKSFEEKESKGKNVQELADQRYGHWLFLYAVIQSLPMLVVDVDNLRYTEGVDYFLCQPPLGNLPWLEDASGVKMAWYGVQGGQGVVSLPSDVVNYGTEGVYRRSHCWTVAQKWINNAEAHEISQPFSPDDQEEGVMSPLAPPPGFGGSFSRPDSRGRENSSRRSSVASNGMLGVDNRSNSRQSQRNSVMLGLEMLPIPGNMEPGFRSDSPGGRESPVSAMGRRGASPYSRNSVISRNSVVSLHGDGRPVSSAGRKESTFDDILGTSGLGQKEKGKKK